MLTYHFGDATEPGLTGGYAIAHVLSDTGAYGAGFAQAVARRYPVAKHSFRAWLNVLPFDPDIPRPGLGQIQWVPVGGAGWVINMIAQRGLRSSSNPHPLDLDALTQCLTRVADASSNITIVMPRIGCGLAGGNWDEVGPIVEATLSHLTVRVYDFPS